MAQALQAENVTLQQLITLYGLQFINEAFFPEWQEDARCLHR